MSHKITSVSMARVPSLNSVSGTSTNAYTTLVTLDALKFRSLSTSVAVATNGVTWKIDKSNNGTDWFQEKAESAVAAGSTESYENANISFRYYRIQIKSSVADTPGTLTADSLLKG